MRITHKTFTPPNSIFTLFLILTMAFGCSQIDDEKTSEPEKCTLTYNANGGSGEMKSMTGNKGSEITLAANTFTRTGYTFTEWNTKADGSGDKYADKGKIKLTANTTLYAQWTASDYKITYNLDGGTNAPGNPDGYNAETETITLQSPTKTGYTFGGWYEAEDFNGNTIESWKAGDKTEDVTLYAKWNANIYKVKFDKNTDDATSDAPADIQATYDVEFELPENKFTKTGYNFAGWNTKADGNGTNYEAKAKVKNLTAENNATVTLYAKWTATKYTITYENTENATNDNPESYTIEDSITLKNPTKDGYTFDGWYESSNFSGTAVSGWNAGEKTENITLYAKWLVADKFIKVPGVSINESKTWTPASEVFISGRALDIKAFLMSDHQVTRREYKEIMGSDPSTAKAYDKDGTELTGNAADNNPVNYVNWYEAIVYCNKRSIKEGLTPCYKVNGSTDPDDWGDVPTSSNDTWNTVTRNIDANGYRLPTEAEWEWAARGGENYTYAGSDDIAEVAWYTENTNDTETREVKTKKSNGYGLYDMSGNVWEWCWDRYGSISTDTPAAGASSGSYRCRRGGSWDFSDSCKVAYRGFNNPYYRSSSCGLRLVRTAQ